MSYSYPPCDLSKILVILYYITKILEWSTILLLAVKNSAWICFSAITFSIQLWPVKDSVQWRGVLLHKSFFKDIYYIPRCLLVTRFGCALLWAAPNHNLNNYWWPVSSPLSGGNLTRHILEVGTSSCHVLTMAHTKQVNLQKSKWYDNCDATWHVYTGLWNPKLCLMGWFLSGWFSGPGCSWFSLCLSALCSGSMSCLLDILLGSSSLVALPGRWFQYNMWLVFHCGGPSLTIASIWLVSCQLMVRVLCLQLVSCRVIGAAIGRSIVLHVVSVANPWI